MELKQSQSRGFDIIKIIAAIGILTSHCSLFVEYDILYEIKNALFDVFIPLFFSISSFLFTKKMESLSANQRWPIMIEREKRLIVMFCIWYIMMLPVVYYKWFSIATLKETIAAIFVGCTMGGYWFIKALIVNTVIVYLNIQYKWIRNWCVVLFGIYYVVTAYNYSYHFLSLSFSPYFSFAYHVIPCLIGMWAAKRDSYNLFNLTRSQNMLIFFILAFATIYVQAVAPIFKIASVILICSIVEQTEFPSSLPYRRMRQVSILIYMIQFGVIFIYEFYQESLTLLNHSIVRSIICLLVSVLLSFMILRLSETQRFGNLKYLY